LNRTYLLLRAMTMTTILIRRMKMTVRMMKYKLYVILAAVVLLVGATGCSKDDNTNPPPIDDPVPPIDEPVSDEDLVGVWWDEFEYADVTEYGIPFSRVLLAVMVGKDHTGCIYLGVYNSDSYVPLAVYGGPEDAGFTWRLLDDGRVQLSDPVTGESYALSRALRASGSNYGGVMTNVSNTHMTYTENSVKLDNGTYSGVLTKANAEEEVEIDVKLTPADRDWDVIPPDDPNIPATSRKDAI